MQTHPGHGERAQESGTGKGCGRVVSRVQTERERCRVGQQGTCWSPGPSRSSQPTAVAACVPELAAMVATALTEAALYCALGQAREVTRSRRARDHGPHLHSPCHVPHSDNPFQTGAGPENGTDEREAGTMLGESPLHPFL